MKSRYKVGPSAYASGALVKCRKVVKNNEVVAQGAIQRRSKMRITEIDNKLFEKCWKGYEKKGMKKMFGKTVPNCVKKESVLDEDYIISLKGKEVSRHKEENEARSAWHKLRKQHGNDVTIKKESILDEDLRAWFGKGKKGGAFESAVGIVTIQKVNVLVNVGTQNR